MKIVFNSRLPQAPCTVFYHDALTQLEHVTAYDYENWDSYDVALFMTYREDLLDLIRIKTENPDLITAIIDPRGEWVKKYLGYADFLIVDSLEMRDYWSVSELPIFEYAEYPAITLRRKKHSATSGKTIIGYHGNKIHLESMEGAIVPALDRLGKEYDVELWAMYNIEERGKWEKGVPDIKVRHIQWSYDNYYDCMAEVDIGIVPCFLPEKNWFRFANLPVLRAFNRFNKTGDDYLLRFKMPTNPGRIIIWGLLNIPVVSDFFPSAMQCIEDGRSGFLACSEGGWYRALRKLSQDNETRQHCADNLTDFIMHQYAFPKQNDRLIHFLHAEFADTFA